LILGGIGACLYCPPAPHGELSVRQQFVFRSRDKSQEKPLAGREGAHLSLAAFWLGFWLSAWVSG